VENIGYFSEKIQLTLTFALNNLLILRCCEENSSKMSAVVNSTSFDEQHATDDHGFNG